MVIHHVEMDQVGAGGLHALDLFAQPREIGRQDAGRDPASLRIRRLVALALRPAVA